MSHNITPVAKTPSEYNENSEHKIKFPTIYSPVSNYEPTYRILPIIDNKSPIINNFNNMITEPTIRPRLAPPKSSVNITNYLPTPIYDNSNGLKNPFNNPFKNNSLNNIIPVPINNITSATTPVNNRFRMLGDNEKEYFDQNMLKIKNIPNPLNENEKYLRLGCIGDGNCLFHAILKSTSMIYILSYKANDSVTEELLQKLEMSVNNTIIFSDYIFNIRRNKRDISTVYMVVNRNEMNKLLNYWRCNYAKIIREDLAKKILIDVNLQKIIKNNFSLLIEIIRDELLSNGVKDENIWEIATTKLLNDMAQKLNSNVSIEPEYGILMLEMLNIDMYLVYDRGLTSDVGILYGGRGIHGHTRGPKDMRPKNSIYREKDNRLSIIILVINNNHYEIIGKETTTDTNKKILLRYDQNEPIIRRLFSEINY